MRKLVYEIVSTVHSIVKVLFSIAFILIHFGTGIAIYTLAGKGIIGLIAGVGSLLLPLVNIFATILWSWYEIGSLSSNYVAFAFQFFGLGLFLVILGFLKLYLGLATGKMSYSPENDLIKIRDANSGLFSSAARKTISTSLNHLKEKIDLAKNLENEQYKARLAQLAQDAKRLRNEAIQDGASDYNHPQWAAAAACETWLHALLSGDTGLIERVEKLIIELSNEH